jgi:hypothetical protein
MISRYPAKLSFYKANLNHVIYANLARGTPRAPALRTLLFTPHFLDSPLSPLPCALAYLPLISSLFSQIPWSVVLSDTDRRHTFE